MKSKSYCIIFGLSVCCAFFVACNSSDSERYTNQLDYTTASQTTSVLTSFGATRVWGSTDFFRCPTVSGITSSNNFTVFSAQAIAPLPHFTLESTLGIRSDSSGGFAISLSQFPIGLLDVYKRCNASPSEQFLTSCPLRYTIVDECSAEGQGVHECVKLYEGTHKLVISAEVAEDEACFTEEIDRSPYSETAPDVAYACDAFSPIDVDAAYRGDAPVELCCSESQQTSLDFCIKPCGCRKLTVKIVPKESAVESNKIKQNVKIAVFSNVNGHEKSFRKLLSSIREKDVDMMISLGNLTRDAKAAQYTSFRQILEHEFVWRDGQASGSDKCQSDESGNICCSAANDRLLSNMCNAVFGKTPFMAGLGENEAFDDVSDYNSVFGVSNMATFVGNVQLILLDTADASLSTATREWLKSILKSPEHESCSIPAPLDGSQWPLLSECRERLAVSATERVTCRDCIQTEAYCIPPDAEHSSPYLGPENCLCVPLESKICPNNMTCQMTDAEHGTCICTRDEDCGIGATCVEGMCRPPLKLVFTYTPPFDQFGTRNDAFTSKSQAISLMSLFAKSNVAAIFSGKSADYGKFSMAGIPIYITGGGGTTMAAFSDYGHHWLLVEIQNAYQSPTPEDISVQVVEF